MTASIPDVLCFPPAPNWFSSHAVASTGDKLVYAASQSIVVLWFKLDGRDLGENERKDCQPSF